MSEIFSNTSFLVLSLDKYSIEWFEKQSCLPRHKLNNTKNKIHVCVDNVVLMFISVCVSNINAKQDLVGFQISS